MAKTCLKIAKKITSKITENRPPKLPKIDHQKPKTMHLNKGIVKGIVKVIVKGIIKGIVKVIVPIMLGKTQLLP